MTEDESVGGLDEFSELLDEGAILIEAKLFERGWLLTLSRYRVGPTDGYWVAYFMLIPYRKELEHATTEFRAATPAHAIARAAIAVIEYEHNQ